MEDEIVGWHHRLNGHEFDQTRGDSKGQGSLACCSSWGHKESDMTDSLNNNEGACLYHAKQEMWVQSLGLEDSLEKEMTIHSGILDWEIQWTEKHGGLQSMGSQESDMTW